MSTSSTGSPSRLGALILVWLLTRSDGGTRAEVDKALAPLLEQRWSDAERCRAVESELITLEGMALIRRIKKTSIVLTDEGRREGLAVLRVKSLPEKTTWATIKAKYLFACALGLPPPAAKKGKRDKSSIEQVSAAILAHHDRIDIDGDPTLTRIADALVWQELGVQTRAPLTLKAVREEILSRALGTTGPQKIEKAMVQLAVKRVKARRAEIDELRTATLSRWIEGTDGASKVLATGAEVQNAPAAPSSPSDDKEDAFAAQVLAAARDSKTGRFGDNKVFISHVFRKLVNGGLVAGDLDAFKDRLVSAHFQGFLSLSRADLVEAMDPEDVDESETQRDGSTFHFVRLEI
ncbi:hypothetical protein WMF26_36310 [Sorangium sp. So ce185]|uniref:hypothetical protein n=1 Tax=Sorangium sp. So ce185 TaxID=3133287 RepID=UPI003F6223D7